jgi:NIPSNAP
MRTFELRQYTLRSKEALDTYMNQVYPLHIDSFPLFGIEPHGVWTVKDSAEPQAFVLVSYPEGVSAAGTTIINRLLALSNCSNWPPHCS